PGWSGMRAGCSEAEHDARRETKIILRDSENMSEQRVSLHSPSHSFDQLVIKPAPMSLANDVSEVEKPLLLALTCPTPNSPWTNGVNPPTETETRGPKSTVYNLASTRDRKSTRLNSSHVA